MGGTTNNYAGGGGGLGAGGDIFVYKGGSLTVQSGTLSGGHVLGGAGGTASNGGQPGIGGLAFGSGIFSPALPVRITVSRNSISACTPCSRVSGFLSFNKDGVGCPVVGVVSGGSVPSIDPGTVACISGTALSLSAIGSSVVIDRSADSTRWPAPSACRGGWRSERAPGSITSGRPIVALASATA